ncbi:MAG: LamG domain-containing protein [Candidatus Helarchaeota archaeon]
MENKKLKIILVTVALFIFMTIAISSILGVGLIDKDLINKKTGGVISPQFKRNVLIQTKVDEFFPCYVQGADTIVCKPIDNEKKEKYRASLAPIDKEILISKGIPVKNIEGNIITRKNIPYDKETKINVDLTQRGRFTIGFGSNEYTITSLSAGVFNNTNSPDGKVYLDVGKLNGNYFTEIMDVDKPMFILNASFVSSQPEETDIGIYVRTHNMTNGTDLSEDLVGYWKFDAPSSTEVFDYSGENITGTLTNMGQYAPTVEGKFSNALEFDGSDDFVNIGNLDITNELTISAWINTGTTANQQIVRKTKAYQLIVLDTGAIRGLIGSGTYWTTSEACDGTTDITDGEWHHVVMTYDDSADSIKIYVDNTEECSDTITRSLGTNNNDAGIGQMPEGGTYARPFDGLIDEVIIYNRALSPDEIAQLYAGELKSWSAWDGPYYAEKNQISGVDNGRYFQLRADFERTSGQNVYLESVSIGYNLSEPGGIADNFPIVESLDVTNGYTFTQTNINLSATVSDDNNLENASLYTNTTGTWHLNQTVSVTGTSNYSNFTIPKVDDGKYIWNVFVCDNASQCAFYSINYSFSVSTACNDEDCYPYVCNPLTNECYTSCTSHTHVNSSSYCGSDGLAHTVIDELYSCKNKEWPGLDDDKVCIENNAIGYCYSDTITIGEYCVKDSTECVYSSDGTEPAVNYSAGYFLCVSGNDAYQCLGGEDAWSDIIDCIDLGDPYDASATYGTHTYCGYYEAATCSAESGCSTPSTHDCGNYYYDGSSCGGTGTDEQKRAACDRGCGAPYDLDNCPSGLSTDCMTCTPPEEDYPPEVTLISPSDDSTQSSTLITISYYVEDTHGMTNCSYWDNASITRGGVWQLVQTNTTAIDYGGSNLNYFTQTFVDGDVVTWNIQCFDNNATENQVGWAPTNYTFTIDITAVPELRFEIYNGSESNPPVFWVNELGDANVSRTLSVTNDAYIYGVLRGDSDGLDVDKLVLSDYLELDSSGTLNVKLDNPYNEYIRFTGEESVGNLLFGLYSANPLITTDSGDKILFGKGIEVSGMTKTTNLNVTSNIYATNINPNGKPLYIGGEYEDGGITIQSGDIFAQNITINSSLIYSGAFEATGSIIPSDTNVYDIGDSDIIWRYGFFRGLNATTEIYIGNNPVSPWLYNMTTATNTMYGQWWYNQTENKYYYNMTHAKPWDYNQSEIGKSVYWYNQTNLGGWNWSGDYVYLNDLSDSVGIGTATPGYDLDVTGDIRATDDMFCNDDLTVSGDISTAGDIKLTGWAKAIIATYGLILKGTDWVYLSPFSTGGNNQVVRFFRQSNESNPAFIEVLKAGTPTRVGKWDDDGNLWTVGNIEADGNLQPDGNLTVDGDTTLGNSYASDELIIKGYMINDEGDNYFTVYSDGTAFSCDTFCDNYHDDVDCCSDAAYFNAIEEANEGPLDCATSNDADKFCQCDSC